MPSVTIITGASAGLGVEFAKQLAAQHVSLMLVARRGDRLEALAKELQAKHKIEVFTEALDLSAPGAVPKLMTAIAKRNLTIDGLINNAGFGLKGEFAQQDISRLLQMINLNCTALVELTHAVLPGMVARKSGAILNVASTAAFQAGPLMAIYYASKAFVLSFSEALHDDMKPHGIHVSCLCPGATETEFGAVAQVTKTMLFKGAGGPEKVVSDGLAALKANKAIAVSGLAHKTFVLGTRLLPRSLTRKIAHTMQK